MGNSIRREVMRLAFGINHRGLRELQLPFLKNTLKFTHIILVLNRRDLTQLYLLKPKLNEFVRFVLRIALVKGDACREIATTRPSKASEVEPQKPISFSISDFLIQ